MRHDIVKFLKNLRDDICTEFETLEPIHTFQRKPWPYQKGAGGGEISTLRGDVFEKAAVNWSGVEGPQLPGSSADAPVPFFATGVSLITHMKNPKAPTVHFNIRYIETKEKAWLGGGFDLTPMGFLFDEDTDHFHSIAKKCLDPFGPDLYENMSQQAKEYFYIPHYQKERGVGGIFFDQFNSGHLESDLQMWKSVGLHFLESIMPIYKRRVDLPYTEEDRLIQLKLRAHYVEYNLLYDRGTKFGFQSGGNPEAILSSMPPLVAW